MPFMGLLTLPLTQAKADGLAAVDGVVFGRRNEVLAGCLVDVGDGVVDGV